MMSGVTLFLSQITLSMYIHERVKNMGEPKKNSFRKNTRRYNLVFLVYSMIWFNPVNQSYLMMKEVCRNARCTSFFVHHYTNLFTFFKLRSFEDFFDLCVPSI